MAYKILKLPAEGPWANEPKEMDFESNGLACFIMRGPVGSLNGYVALPPGHPAHGKGYDNIEVEVHGGLTYASASKPGESKSSDLWWIGFDTAHYGDLSPMFTAHEGDIYRDINYVKAETESLAKQMADYKPETA